MLVRFKTMSVVSLLVFSVNAQQNLVINGDFEEHTDCPDLYSTPTIGPKEIEKCVGWKAPTYGTSDYYHSCATNSVVSVPNNICGEQAAFNGEGYLGAFFTTYSFSGGGGYDGYSGIMWWEYIQGQLTSPLEKDKIYKFSMEVSLAEFSDLMINEIGVYFSQEAISSPNSAALNVQPQCVFYDPGYFRDTINWVHLETYFIAGGGEKYLTIGNFRDNVSTDTLRRYDVSPLMLNPFATHFYMDHVVLTDSYSEIPLSNVFSPNGDGINDYWKPPLSQEKGQKQVIIMNRWGNLIYEADLSGFAWNGKTSGGDDCSEGVYFYKISNTNISGFVELIR